MKDIISCPKSWKFNDIWILQTRLLFFLSTKFNSQNVVLENNISLHPRQKRKKKVQLKNNIKKIRKKIFDSVQIAETFLLYCKQLTFSY